MKLRLLIPVICLSALLACNNSSGDKEKTGDTTTMNHDGMDHPPVTGAVPALPEIPEGAKVVFSNLKNKSTITFPFKLQMGVDVMRIDTAGPVVAGSGHHHLIIDGPDSLAAGTIVPKDSVNIHFGKGETEYQLILSPGPHKLTLQLADGLHRSYGGRLAATVMVNVKE
jgi:hypothetical protein